jgi:hypothetical protein
VPSHKQVHVAGLAQRHVGVVNLRQDDALARNRFDAPCIETVQNTDHFARQKKGPVNVSLITLASRCQLRRRHDATQTCEILIQQRRCAVMIGEAKYSLPLDPPLQHGWIEQRPDAAKITLPDRRSLRPGQDPTRAQVEQLALGGPRMWRILSSRTWFQGCGFPMFSHLSRARLLNRARQRLCARSGCCPTIPSPRSVLPWW